MDTVVAQRLCQHAPKGYTLDRDNGLWVCGKCFLPSPAYYLRIRGGMVPGYDFKYSKGLEDEMHPEVPPSNRGRVHRRGGDTVG